MCIQKVYGKTLIITGTAMHPSLWANWRYKNHSIYQIFVSGMLNSLVFFSYLILLFLC